MTTTLAVPPEAPTTRIDNRATYIGFGLAYVVGHGSAALSRGTDPLVDLPQWLPTALLFIGLAAGTVCATVAALRAQRDAEGGELLSARLLGFAWIVGFGALFLAITGLTSTVDAPDLANLLWPAGSGLIVGLIYVAEGAHRRNVLHYSLGTWLALISTSAFFFSAPVFFWILAVLGGGGYAVATVLERRRLACA
ncbi:hypothetical protein [Nocardia sp. BMG51109]|uniref:hypothetical protein n=1 Tax=Nocardia sp. BMG51109 TaxID=1056816 RepID=UPI000466B138|nr:hypothetical protein [Nocardia sp. BMG51109]